MLIPMSLGLAGQRPVPVSFVGGNSNGDIGGAHTVTVALNSLTGGDASAASAGDFVVVAACVGDNVNDLPVVDTSGYTTLVSGYVNDSYDTNYIVAYKYLNSAEASVTVSAGGRFNSALTVIAYVYTNVDPIDPIGGSAAAEETNTAKADPPSIAAEGCCIGIGFAAVPADDYDFASSDLDDFRTLNLSATYSGMTGIGHLLDQPAGAFNPAEFSLATADNAGFSCAGVSMYLNAG